MGADRYLDKIDGGTHCAAMIRLVQIACIVVTALVLFGIGKSLDVVGSLFGPGFDGGFVVGAVFVIATYGLICWLDPASRPRGSAPRND